LKKVGKQGSSRNLLPGNNPSRTCNEDDKKCNPTEIIKKANSKAWKVPSKVNWGWQEANPQNPTNKKGKRSQR
jgi:hypothetical protein